MTNELEKAQLKEFHRNIAAALVANLNANVLRQKAIDEQKALDEQARPKPDDATPKE